MSKGTEGPSGTAATLLHVITLSGFIDLWVKLLFCPRVAILTSLCSLTFTGIPPFLALFHSWTWQRSVFVLVRAASPVFAVVVVRTGITLTAQTGWFLAEFCLVVGQHIVVILPAWFLTQDLLYEGCTSCLTRLSISSTSLCGPGASLRLHYLHFSDIINRAAQVM